MPSTRNLQASAAWVLPIINYQPINISGDEPALSAANLTKQVMLGAPFKWAWNRTEISFACVPASTGVPAKQDYLLVIADLGFLERASIVDATGNAKELEIKTSLAAESAVQRPRSIALQRDDNAGNLIVRINALPDQAYSVILQYQRKAMPLTSMAATWAPIPDELAYIFDWGFLSLCSLLVKDARFPIFGSRFTAHLLAAAEGLDEMDRNLFLGNWMQLTQTQQRSQIGTQQGASARGV